MSVKRGAKVKPRGKRFCLQTVTEDNGGQNTILFIYLSNPPKGCPHRLFLYVLGKH